MKTKLAVIGCIATLWTASNGIEPNTESQFGSPALDAAIELMESDELKEHVALRGGHLLAKELLGFLQVSFEGEEGEKLLEQTLWMLEHGNAQQQRKAMILASQCEEIPMVKLEQLMRSANKVACAWAAYHPLSKKEEGRIASDTSLFTNGLRGGVDPLVACRSEIGDQLRLDDEALSTKKQEFIDGYKAIFLPNLKKLETFAAADQRYWADTDGDGRDELYVRLAIPDGWDAAVVSIELRQDDQGQWSVHSLHKYEGQIKRAWYHGNVLNGTSRSDFLIADLDADGLPEICEASYSVNGGAGNYQTVRGKNLNRVFSGYSRKIASSPWGETFVARETLVSNPTGYGKAFLYTTSFGSEIRLTEFLPDGIEEVITVIVPRR